MPAELLRTICSELDRRVSDLRPFVLEYEQLIAAADALGIRVDSQSTPSDDESLSSGPSKPPRSLRSPKPKRPTPGKSAPKASISPPKKNRGEQAPSRSASEAPSQAILEALEHGSHTVNELVMVTAMSGQGIRNGISRLIREGAIKKIEREGKVAYALG